MHTYFGPDFFTQNRERLQAALPDHGPIVITANGNMQRAGDELAAFTQDSNFWYLTGLNDPDVVLVMTRQDQYVIVPTKSFEREAFDGAYDLGAISARSGITNVLNSQDGWERVRHEIESSHEVTTLLSPPAYEKRHALHTLPYRRRLLAELKRIDNRVIIYDARQELATMRCLKQPEELSAIQKSIDITTATLKEVTAPEAIAVVRHEYELEAGLTYGFRRRGASGHAFMPIVGAGSHSTTLHHIANNGSIAADDLIVLDVGAEVEHYAADISRTVSRRPLTGRQAEVFRAVRTVQDFALAQIRPGIMPRDYELSIEAFMGEQLLRLGVITEPSHENIRRYFPHATSHFLGLDVHDVGDYRLPWQAGMVVTCEPGIYIPEERIGIRIEDDVLITEAGNTVLSAACPRELTPVQ